MGRGMQLFAVSGAPLRPANYGGQAGAHAEDRMQINVTSSCFLLPGASPPTQPRSDEVNNQGVSFKYQLAQ